MKVALFQPPMSNLCQPYLSTAALLAYLKQNGVEEVVQYDLNLAAAEELLRGADLVVDAIDNVPTKVSGPAQTTQRYRGNRRDTAQNGAPLRLG